MERSGDISSVLRVRIPHRCNRRTRPCSPSPRTTFSRTPRPGSSNIKEEGTSCKEFIRTNRSHCPGLRAAIRMQGKRHRSDHRNSSGRVHRSQPAESLPLAPSVGRYLTLSGFHLHSSLRETASEQEDEFYTVIRRSPSTVI